jgi:deoxyribonuclease-4
VERAEALGAQAVQVFTQSPRTWRPTNHSEQDFERFRERAGEVDIEAFCHATYLINLAATDDTTFHRSVQALATTLEVADGIGASGVVFHVGSHLGRGLDRALEQVVPALDVVLGQRGDSPTWLLVENSAGPGGTIGVGIEEVARVIDELRRPERVGVCLDTCHLWASGVDVGDPERVDELLAEVDERIGLERLRCLHVNDSKLPLGTNRDRHENVGQGEIGDGLAVMLGHPKLQGLPALSETNGADGKGFDQGEMQALTQLHAAGVKLWKGRRGRRR